MKYNSSLSCTCNMKKKSMYSTKNTKKMSSGGLYGSAPTMHMKKKMVKPKGKK